MFIIFKNTTKMSLPRFTGGVEVYTTPHTSFPLDLGEANPLLPSLPPRLFFSQLALCHA